MQRLPETTPHRPLSHPQLPLRQIFQATPGLPVKQDKIQQYEISMPVDVSIETGSQPYDNPQQSVRSKTAQLATHTQNVPPSAVSWHQSGTCSSASAQHQPSAHALGPDKPFYGLPTTGHQTLVNPHQSKVPTVSSQTNLHNNVTTIQASPNMANRMPTDMSPSPNGLYLPPAFTVPLKAHIPAYPGMIHAPSMYTSPCDLQYPAAMAVSPQANLPGHPTAVQIPPSFGYDVPNAMYSRPPDSLLPPVPPVLSGTSYPHKADPIQLQQTSYDRQHTLHSNCAIVPSSSTPVYAAMIVPVHPASHMYAQQPSSVQQSQITPYFAYQRDANIHSSAMTTPQPSFTQTHQVRNVQMFNGGPDCRVFIEDWIRDMQYLLDAGGMPENLSFATVVRHLNGEARRLVLNLPSKEQTAGRAFEELRAEYSDMQTSLDPLADFYERCQRPGESACSYAIALEASLRSVEEAQCGGQPFPDRDSKLTRQFIRGLSDEEVYHRIASMKPRLLSFRELQAELRNLARETRKFQTQPRAKKTYTQAQFTTTSGNLSDEKLRTEKGNRQNTDLTELTVMVKKLVSSQEDQINRLTQLEARVGATRWPVLPQTQRSQGSAETAVRGVVCHRCGKPGHIARLCRTMMTDEAVQAEIGAETRQDLNA
ncbi:uncharacterized protein coro2ab isoform X1 [Triplophysa dalaica]|uniref:uncharacterized protein coro2ab isoform X1 n=1 Tax=Triplophysa dalaica TaxID=1582913 RepID=UPI0024DFF8EE|nr:uncharacterized protein coro2ab isoform X1 [Triplophysa dalaica]XP_056589970.1 uncharacterized protein coro2ab isoform X1 [Triplophysa dalaica]XP_056589971.1 uncharacterized protein coro2ab isoform X1 [Triplophysa dalaica]